jgi:hypothetical protein
MVALLLTWTAGVLEATSVTGELTEVREQADQKTVRISKVSELLDKYAANQDKLNSFICKWEASTRMNASLSEPPYRALSGKSRKVELREFDCDGNRYSEKRSTWGNIRSVKDFIRKERAPYNSQLWDGQRFFDYIAMTNQPGRLGMFADVNELPETMRLAHQRDLAGLGAILIRGFYPIHNERVDFAIRKAQTISVGDRTERINGSECYSIVAEDASKKCTIWIDPVHGYHLAKGQVQYKDNDLFLSQENIRFEKVGDFWIIAEAVAKRVQKFRNGDFTDDTTVLKLIEIKINPDHERLSSFLPDDILDKTMVLFQGETWKKTHSHIRTVSGHIRSRMRSGVLTSFNEQGQVVSYTWRDGKIMDENNSIVADFLNTDVRGSSKDAKQ